MDMIKGDTVLKKKDQITMQSARTSYCMLYAVLFTKIMQLPEFMHLRAFLVCVFTERAANVWGLGMGRARGLK